jgi:hypothetical protein
LALAFGAGAPAVPLARHPEDRCAHGVAGEVCVKCHPALADRFAAAGDWCTEPAVPESQCGPRNPPVLPAAPAVPEKPSEVRPSNSVASAETKPASRRSKQPPKAATPPAAKPPPNPVASQAAAPATPDPGAPDLNAKPW